MLECNISFATNNISNLILNLYLIYFFSYLAAGGTCVFFLFSFSKVIASVFSFIKFYFASFRNLVHVLHSAV